MSTFLLHIVTPESDFYTGEVEYLNVNTPDGQAGFLSGASPRVLLLTAGEITVKTSVVETKITTGDGIISVTDAGVTIVTESCKYSDDKADNTVIPSQASDTKTYKRMRAKLAATVRKMRSGAPDDV